MDGLRENFIGSVRGQSAAAWISARRLLSCLDALATVIALLVSFLLLDARVAGVPSARMMQALFQLLITVSLVTLLYRAGQYSSDRRMSAASDLAALIKGTFAAFFLVSGVWFTTDGFFTGFRDQSRVLVFSGMLIFCGLLAINRLFARWYQRKMFARGEGMKNVILVGQGRVATEFARTLERRWWLGVRCVGTVPARGRSFSIDRIRQLMQTGVGSGLIIALDAEEHANFERITVALNRAGLSFGVVPSLFEESLFAARSHDFRELPVIADVDIDPLDKFMHVFKRAFDIAVSACALLVLSPLLAVVALAVKLSSPGPVIFRQVRIGATGRPFEILKFRTMVTNAEELLEELKSSDEGDGPHFKMKYDPRITKIGAFLRKWSLDELLQFANVLRGDMSLVGPRPPLPREVDQYELGHLGRLRGKPGITGLWQVSGRKDLTFDDMVRLDRQYLENWSLLMDLDIMFRTVSVVLARRGAY
ncbi:MAG: hypothetical protein A2133_08435 [Actinobacteria bacterium RBG_16_64_13]|nr:MAG: hypothetical protein A2133_08435 [Actinobacteria bacterium RBG_16_64_13]